GTRAPRDKPTDAPPAPHPQKESPRPPAGASSIQAPARPWDAPPPPGPLLPQWSRGVSSTFGMR
ncbi:UNVERIFIED_CONTAM: hypothetical protein Sindi_0156900, partial [Sesamum indicum]